jgi:hypothetical protein
MADAMVDSRARLIPSTYFALRSSFLCYVLGLSVFLLPLDGVGQTVPSSDSITAAKLSGKWKIDKEVSTAIDPWRDMQIEIDATSSQLTLDRNWEGYHGFSVSDSMTIPIDGSTHQVSMSQWPDNRHIGAFLAEDSLKSVSARWLDEGRTLQVTTRLKLKVSQGTSQVRTHSEYRVSPSGAHLIVLELRSTRPRPIRYRFEEMDPS